MPFCPECRLEYKPYVKVCPDCGAALVDKLPEIGLEDNVDAVLLYKSVDYFQAQLVAGALEEAGIPFLGRHLGLADRLGKSVLGAITHVTYVDPKPAEIYVNPADLERAKELLEGLETDAGTEEESENDEN